MSKETRIKILNISLLISLWFCYIDIYKYGQEFFIETQINFMSSMFSDLFLFFVISFLIVGQLCLVVPFFIKNYRRYNLIGILITFFYWFILVLGSFLKIKSLLSMLPYLIILILLVRELVFKKNDESIVQG